MNLLKAASKNNLTVLGIMNGTSLDGVDFVFCKISRGAKAAKSVRFISEKSFPFPKDLHQRLKLAAQDKMSVHQLGLLHHDLGRFYASCFRKLPASSKKVDLIGVHGQTVFHQAPQATLQIGEPSYLAAESKATVVSDFRAADMALGGQGAPIATLFHQLVFAKKERVSIHNLGGISNLSIVSPKGVERAFDTGPANMMLDLCMQKITKGKKKFDLNGAFAKKGRPDLDIIESMLGHKFFYKAPPKSCGREEFGEIFLDKFLTKAKKLKPEDKMATLLEFTAWSIVLSYEHYVRPLPKKIIFCGGGANNKALLNRIAQLLPQIEISTTEDHGWSVSSIEGAAFALLAAHRVWNFNSNLPGTTGAKRAVPMGKITVV